MNIHINKSYQLNSGSPTSKEENIKVLFKELVESQGSVKTEWVNEDQVKVNNIPSTQLHTFILEAEKLGKKIQYSKQTVITVID